MRPEEERQLIELARLGDVEVFMRLTREYEHQIFQLTFHLTGNREDAADLTQETFLQAFRAMKKFRGEASFHTWLYRIAINLSLNFLKKSRREKNGQESVEEIEENRGGAQLEYNFSQDSPEDSSLSAEFVASLKKAIDELPPAYRVTFSLVVLEEMSHKEAAGVLGCSEKTVSWRVHEARKMLKKKLQSFLTLKQEV
ncbi:MAG: sigma-70 family RNA polymerase sigma factor [Acidobacteriota bacterium]|nr:sigma-70 family RNA polymerase sigma factor [Acidobacteriota bacterium]